MEADLSVADPYNMSKADDEEEETTTEDLSSNAGDEEQVVNPERKPSQEMDTESERRNVNSSDEEEEEEDKLELALGAPAGDRILLDDGSEQGPYDTDSVGSDGHDDKTAKMGSSNRASRETSVEVDEKLNSAEKDIAEAHFGANGGAEESESESADESNKQRSEETPARDPVIDPALLARAEEAKKRLAAKKAEEEDEPQDRKDQPLGSPAIDPALLARVEEAKKKLAAKEARNEDEAQDTKDQAPASPSIDPALLARVEEAKKKLAEKEAKEEDESPDPKDNSPAIDPALLARAEEAKKKLATKKGKSKKGKSKKGDKGGGGGGGAAAAAAAATTSIFGGVKSLFKSQARKESDNTFKSFDQDGNKVADQDEIAQFVASNHKLWAMLSVNLDRPEEECQAVATQVAMELASGLKGQEAMEAEINKKQFHKFRKRYMLDPQGSQEFFHRAIFATFDTDGNGLLDEDELEDFMEIFYKSGSIFSGDARLPPKEELKKILMEEFDAADTRSLTFEAVRYIISGGTSTLEAKTNTPEELDELARSILAAKKVAEANLDAERERKLSGSSGGGEARRGTGGGVGIGMGLALSLGGIVMRTFIPPKKRAHPYNGGRQLALRQQNSCVIL